MKNLESKKYDLLLTDLAIEDLKKLDKQQAKRILDKLYFYCSQKNPLFFAKKLSNFKYGNYRFRIGNFRASFDIKTENHTITLIILVIRHRREIYK